MHQVNDLSRTLALIIGALLTATFVHAAPNPLLIHTGDVGVMEDRGEYYLMGVGTNGRMFHSSDLIDWRDVGKAFTMQNDWTSGSVTSDEFIHACDMNYINGVYHLYWSVNDATDIDHPITGIGHAVSSNPTGPYREPVPQHVFDHEIDPHLFRDDDGQYYFYTVQFRYGNEIWVQPMADPWTLVGKRRQLIFTRNESWERADPEGRFLVNEGPDVFRYRDRYYMLYNVNHTDPHYGNYAMGCVEADSPTGFSNAGKYREPILRWNQEAVLAARPLIQTARHEQPATWRFTESAPAADWFEQDFDDAEWQEGQSGFGWKHPTPPSLPGGGVANTPWGSHELWLRHRFTLDAAPGPGLRLLVHHDDGAEIWINGVPVYRDRQYKLGYGVYDFPTTAGMPLHVGENVIAVKAVDDTGSRYIDVGLIDFGEEPPVDWIFNCGQASVVPGPNGFEHWMTYFAINNGGFHHQCADRVMFNNRRLYIDGPTSKHTAGYHPAPAMPTFRDRFAMDEPRDKMARWQHLENDGDWAMVDGAYDQRAHVPSARALAITQPGTNYRLRLSVKVNDVDKAGRAGALACYIDEEHWLKIGLELGYWNWQWRSGNEVQSARLPLPEGLLTDVWQPLEITREGGLFRVRLAGIPAPVQDVIETPLTAPGRPGLYSEYTAAAFDGVHYTIGWDEWGERITGWEGMNADWRIDAEGLWHESDGMARLFKGDALDQYEISAWVEPRGWGKFGFEAIWLDEQNNLRVELDIGMPDIKLIETRDGVETVLSEDVIEVSDGWQLRFVNVDGRQYLFVNGRQIAETQGDWPAARTGLFASGLARFDAITCYDLP